MIAQQPDTTVEQTQVDLSADPFSPENIQVLHYITLARIYDVLMANLTETNPEAANSILELHRTGKLLGPPPGFDGTFMTVSAPAAPAE